MTSEFEMMLSERLVAEAGTVVERLHLLAKLRLRAPAEHRTLARVRVPEAHPLFRLVSGDIPVWERTGRKPALERTRRRRVD